MALEKNSIIAVIASIVAIFWGAAGVILGYDTGQFLIPFISIIGGLVLYFEVGVKRFTNLSAIKSLGSQQILTVVVGSIAIINGIFSLPFVAIMVPFFEQVSALILFLVGLFVGIEFFTK